MSSTMTSKILQRLELFETSVPIPRCAGNISIIEIDYSSTRSQDSSITRLKRLLTPLALLGKAAPGCTLRGR